MNIPTVDLETLFTKRFFKFWLIFKTKTWSNKKVIFKVIKALLIIIPNKHMPTVSTNYKPIFPMIDTDNKTNPTLSILEIISSWHVIFKNFEIFIE